MANKELDAWINWDRSKNQWTLRIWEDEEWKVSKAWEVRRERYLDRNGDTIDFVNDDILCEIARLQDMGYKVKVDC